MHTTQYNFVKPDLSYSQIADIVKQAISTAVPTFHQGNGFRPDLVAITNCVKFGERNGDGTYKPNTEMEDTFHIRYSTKTVGQLVVSNQVIVDFYGEAPLSNFESVKNSGRLETVPKDREPIEQAILRELETRGLFQISDTDSMPLLP